MYTRSHHRNLNQMLIVAFMVALTLFSYLMPYLFASQPLVGH